MQFSLQQKLIEDLLLKFSIHIIDPTHCSSTKIAWIGSFSQKESLKPANSLPHSACFRNECIILNQISRATIEKCCWLNFFRFSFKKNILGFKGFSGKQSQFCKAIGKHGVTYVAKHFCWLFVSLILDLPRDNIWNSLYFSQSLILFRVRDNSLQSNLGLR